MKRLIRAFQLSIGLTALMASAGAVVLRAQAPMFMQADAFRFEENRGQIVDTRKQPRPDILFGVEGNGLRFFLRRTGVSYVFYQWAVDTARVYSYGHTPVSNGPRGPIVTSYRLDVELVGANLNPGVLAESPAPDAANYYLGHCRGGITGVHRYERVTLTNVYPGIDLVYRTQGDALKYDFVVHPRGRVSDIHLRYQGADEVELGADGSILAHTQYGDVSEAAPVVYQLLPDGRHVPLAANYITDGADVAYDIPAWTSGATVVIDPVLRWSTYLGGTGTDVAEDIACHPDYDTAFTVVGSTSSIDFPTTAGVAQVTKAASGGAKYVTADGFIARFTTGGGRLWITYLGGGDEDDAQVVGLDEVGNTYIAGSTASPDFPVTADAYDGVGGPNSSFVAKLDVNGRLSWSTYFRGTDVNALTVSPTREVAIGGSATGTLATTPGAYQQVGPRSGEAKGFIAKFNGDGALRWSTYFGGTPMFGQRDAESVTALTFSRTGDLFACGWTSLSDFPTTIGAFQPAIARGNDPNDAMFANRDGWLAKFDGAGSPQWSTFCGGTGRDVLADIALDPGGNPVVVGSTRSTNFPTTTGTYQPLRDGGDSLATDGLVAKFSAAGALMWGTYFGGRGPDDAREIAIGRDGSYWIGFSATSPSFPVTDDAYLGPLGAANGGGIVKLDGTGNRLWATCLSLPNNTTLPRGICVNRQGCIVCGISGKNFITTPGVFQRDYSGGQWDGMMMMFCDFSLSVEPHGQVVVCAGDSVVLTASEGLDWYRWSNGATTRSITVRQSGNYIVSGAHGDCAGSSSDMVTVTVLPRPQRRLRTVGSTTLCFGDSVVLYTDPGIRQYRWSNGDTTKQIVVRRPGMYSLAYVDSNGCSAETDTLRVAMNPRVSAVIAMFGANPICEGGGVTLDAGPGYRGYSWVTGDTTQMIVATKPGAYTVRVLTAEGCWSEPAAPALVQVNPRPRVTIRALLPTQICEGDSTVLVAYPTINARYEWSNGLVGPRAVIRESGRYTLRITDTNGCTSEASMQVAVAPRPKVRISPNGPTTFCSGDSVVLSAGPYPFVTWSTGETGSSIVARVPGKYFAIVSNIEGCGSTTDTIVVTTVPQPAARVSGPATVCTNSRASYNTVAAPGMAYGWSVSGAGGTIVGGAGTPTITVQWGNSGIGVVRVGVQNIATGCIADTNVVVSIGSALAPIVSANRSLALCPGDSVELDAGVYAAYTWSNGARTRNITARTPGIYSVRVSDGRGCEGTSEPVVVTQAPVQSPTISMANDGFFCADGSIELDAGAGYRSYLWSNGFTSQRITARHAGQFHVVVTDSSGCSWSAPRVTVTPVDLPSMKIIGPRGVCVGSSSEFTIDDRAGSVFAWRINGGTIVDGQGTNHIRVAWGTSMAGTVDVVQQSREGCAAAAPQFNVRVGDSLEPLITPGGPVLLCEGGSVALDAGGGYASYRWSNGKRTRVIMVDQPGTYSVQVVNSSGCRGTSGTVDVVQVSKPAPRIVSSGPLEFCDGDSVTLRVDRVYDRVVWSDGSTDDHIVVRRPGRYAIEATNENGCTAVSGSVEVVVRPLPEAPSVEVDGNRLTASGASGYQWYLGTRPIPGATTPQYLADVPGTYHVVGMNEFGCSAMSRSVEVTRNLEHQVMLDTVTAAVGQRFRMALRVVPGLTPFEAVRSYRAYLRFDPTALFVHDVISSDRTTTGDPSKFNVGPNGELVVTHPDAGHDIAGDGLFEIEFEGLVSAIPVNSVWIDSVRCMPDVALVTSSPGIVLLTGCEVGTPFSRRVHIIKLQPNPTTGVAQLDYSAPEGAVPEMRVVDGLGNEVVRRRLDAATGAEERMQLMLRDLPSGLYWLELSLAGERSAMPILVTR